MKPPTIEQLRVIVARAYRGPLSPEEVARLAHGIDRLASRPRLNYAASWATRLHTVRRKLHELHYPIQRGSIAACAECSGWNGRRCVGLVTQWPCPTLETVDDAIPRKEPAA